MSGGKIELTKYGEELYRKGELIGGSLLRVEGENVDHVILTVDARESNVLYEELFQLPSALNPDVKTVSQ